MPVLVLAQWPAWELSGRSAQTPLSGPFFTDAVSCIPRLPLTPAPGRLKQKVKVSEACHEVKVSLDFIVHLRPAWATWDVP